MLPARSVVPDGSGDPVLSTGTLSVDYRNRKPPLHSLLDGPDFDRYPAPVGDGR